MKYSVDKREKYSVFKLDEDRLDAVISPDVKSIFVGFRNEEVRNLIFDLSDVKFVDSSGLSAILTAHRLWKSDNFGTFLLTGVNHYSVKKLIEISRLNSVITIIPTLQESYDYVMMAELERELLAEQDTDENMQ